MEPLVREQGWKPQGKLVRATITYLCSWHPDAEKFQCIPKQKDSPTLRKLPSYGERTNSKSATVMLHVSVQRLLFQSTQPRERRTLKASRIPYTHVKPCFGNTGSSPKSWGVELYRHLLDNSITQSHFPLYPKENLYHIETDPIHLTEDSAKVRLHFIVKLYGSRENFPSTMH